MPSADRSNAPLVVTAQTTLRVALIVLVFGITLAVFWLALPGIVVIAIGVLLAVLLDAGARGLGHLLPGSRRLHLVLVFALAASLVSLAFWWGGSIVASQANSFYLAMQNLFEEASNLLQQAGLISSTKGGGLAGLIPSTAVLFGSASAVVGYLIRALTFGAAILFLGAFFAWNPPIYKSIILSLFPKERRPRLNEVLDLAGHAMREWLIGQSISMLAIFLFTLAALVLVGMRYPLLLALQAGMLTFVPTLGPFVAGVIIILAGLSQGLTMALYGLVTYMLIQFLESHVITPLVQQRTIHLPPAAILGLQLIAVFLMGLLGVAFVVPIAAAVIVIVQELYVKDRLGGPWTVDDQSTITLAWDRVSGYMSRLFRS